MREKRQIIFKLYPGAIQISFLIFQTHFSIVGWKAVVILKSNCKGRKDISQREPSFGYLTHPTSRDVFRCAYVP